MRRLLLFLLSVFIFFTAVSKAYAIENPLSVPNNKFGIHILFPTEINDAASLVNSTGGQWGYVTIPIQAGDKDVKKWQEFLNKAKELRIIPIIRLATEGDYFNTQVWRKPTELDIIDFANFLNSLNWPVKNRYIIVFNEVNRGNEWGGQANPSEYADLLSYAVTTFKSKSQDFFIISAGMDNAAPDNGTKFINEYNFLSLMNIAVPGIFNQVDGISSHSYPNPGFSQPPNVDSKTSIFSFKYEKGLIDSMSIKDLPVFITETGWSNEVVTNDTIADYEKIAFLNVWNNKNIVAITPFILRADTAPFNYFSLISPDGTQRSQYQLINSIPKIKGQPTLSDKVLGENTKKEKNLVTRDFSNGIKKNDNSFVKKVLIDTLFWILKI